MPWDGQGRDGTKPSSRVPAGPGVGIEGLQPQKATPGSAARPPTLSINPPHSPQLPAGEGTGTGRRVLPGDSRAPATVQSYPQYG